MLVFLIICILFLSLAALPLRIGMDIRLNFFVNNGHVKAYLFGIPVFKGEVHFQHETGGGNNIIIQHGKRAGEIHLNTDPNDKKSVAALMQVPIMSNVLIEQVDAHFIIGKDGDAFFTTMLTSGIRIIFYSVMAYIKSRQNVTITESFTTDCNNDKLEAEFISIINISLADIICSLAGDWIKKAKRKRAKAEVQKI